MFVCFISHFGYGQITNLSTDRQVYQFKKLTVENGLITNIVLSIGQDHKRKLPG